MTRPSRRGKCRLSAPGMPFASRGAATKCVEPEAASSDGRRSCATHSITPRSPSVITGSDAGVRLDRASSALDATGCATPPVSSSSTQRIAASASRRRAMSRSASARIRWSSRRASSGSGLSSARNAAIRASCARSRGPVRSSARVCTTDATRTARRRLHHRTASTNTIPAATPAAKVSIVAA